MPVVPASWGDPSHFEWRETPELDAFWCKLCSRCVDVDHIRSAEHVKKAVFSLSASSPTSLAASPAPTDVEEEPAADPPGLPEVRTASAALRWLQPEEMWKSVWSHEHGRYYYYHVETHETTWSSSHSREERLNKAQHSEFRP